MFHKVFTLNVVSLIRQVATKEGCKNSRLFYFWIYKQGFKVLFIAYCCPFVPGFLVTITSALSGKDIRNFAPAMLCGKLIMFLVVSYPASDVVGFIKNPIKIVLFLLLVFLAWKVGNSINTKLDKNN